MPSLLYLSSHVCLIVEHCFGSLEA